MSMIRIVNIEGAAVVVQWDEDERRLEAGVTIDIELDSDVGEIIITSADDEDEGDAV